MGVVVVDGVVVVGVYGVGSVGLWVEVGLWV